MTSKTCEEKLRRLQENLKAQDSVAVAFSAGVDSTFLLKVAHDVLGERAFAVTARAVCFPARDSKEAEDFCRAQGVRLHFLDFDQMAVEGFCENPKNRCYLCKRALFSRLIALAKEQGAACVAEGTNADDVGDYRPGLSAIRELGVKSPLLEAGLTKEDIRALSKEMGLSTWDKPSFACLATRFAYGETITETKLAMVGKAEQFLLDRGFRQVRVRLHGEIARIEVEPSDFPLLLRDGAAKEIRDALGRLGFSYVTLDLGGYVTGSMNGASAGGAKPSNPL